jgi:3-oxoacyl-[acyl-carrier protein] reductase
MQRVVLITGAAGGLGRGLVEAFAREGWRVAAGWHRTSLASQSDSVWPVPLDVTDRAQVRKTIDELVARWGRIDVLVNNAGAMTSQVLPQLKEADWDHLVDVNLKGAFLCSQAVLRRMLDQRDGHILNVSSFAGRSGAQGRAAYAAAKAGLLGLTGALAKEVGSRNVRVNAVLPGALRTPMTAGLPPKVLDQFAAANALRRLNSVDEVARFMVLLAGLQNVSGQVFQLDSRIAPWG